MLSLIEKNNIKEHNTKGLSDDDLDVESRLPKSYILFDFSLAFLAGTKGDSGDNGHLIWSFD
jgi:hypothetical protein